MVVYLCVISNFVILDLNTNGYRVSFLGLGLSFNRSNTMGVASEAGTEYPSEKPECNSPGFIRGSIKPRI